MNEDSVERRIAELECQPAEQKHVAGPDRGGVTAEQVRSVAFPEASRSQGAYDRDEVDAFVERVEASLRHPTAAGAMTPADIRNVAFSQPPMGKFGYREGEVDLYLDRARIELTRRATGQGPDEPVRCLLYPYGGWDQQIPARAIDMVGNAIRVIDLKSNELIASIPLGEVTAKPAQYGGGPVLVLSGPGMDSLPIAPHPIPGVWRTRPKSKKPAYLAVEDDWLGLTEKFGLASGLADECVPHNVGEHILRFFQENGTYARKTWRTPLLFGLLVGVPGAIYGSLLATLFGVLCLVLAALAWRFKWEL